MLVIVNREEDIHKHNNCRAKEYEHAMLKWEAEGSNPKTEPCMPKGSKEEMLVCMCCVTQCKDKYTGSGCIVCEEYVTNSPEKMVPWDTNTAMCTCGPCRCKCSVYFPRTKWQTVEFAAAEEKDRLAKEAAAKTASTKRKQTSEYIFFTIFLRTRSFLHLTLPMLLQLLIKCFRLQKRQRTKTVLPVSPMESSPMRKSTSTQR